MTEEDTPAESDMFIESHKAFIALVEALKPFERDAQLRAMRSWLILFNDGEGP